MLWFGFVPPKETPTNAPNVSMIEVLRIFLTLYRRAKYALRTPEIDPGSTSKKCVTKQNSEAGTSEFAKTIQGTNRLIAKQTTSVQMNGAVRKGGGLSFPTADFSTVVSDA